MTYIKIVIINLILIRQFNNSVNICIYSFDKKFAIIGTPEENVQLQEVNFVFGKTKYNGQETESQDLDLIPSKLRSCSVDESKQASPKNQNNDAVISMLSDIHKNVNFIRSDVKLALDKISVLEQSVQDLKNDNTSFKEMLKNVGTNDSANEKLGNGKTVIQSSTVDFILEKIEFLHKSVQDLKTENDLLKTGLRQFVLLE